jgi:hypothetical protein
MKHVTLSISRCPARSLLFPVSFSLKQFSPRLAKAADGLSLGLADGWVQSQPGFELSSRD